MGLIGFIIVCVFGYVFIGCVVKELSYGLGIESEEDAVATGIFWPVFVPVYIFARISLFIIRKISFLANKTISFFAWLFLKKVKPMFDNRNLGPFRSHVEQVKNEQ